MTAPTRSSDLQYTLELVRSVCRYAGDFSLIEDTRQTLQAAGVLDAIRTNNSHPLYDWLLTSLSMQGISDAVALSYMEQHGHPDYQDISEKLDAHPSCPKLRSYWHFEDCGYQKSSCLCSRPEHFQNCPLPRHALRNGRLNQTAYSLFLFIRDVADGDLVGWIDQQLARADQPGSPFRLQRMRAAIIDPLSNVFGVSRKTLSMSLSTLLIGAGEGRERWLEVGVSMIAVDTLVHNFLHRTGIVHRLGKLHPYGPACYQPSGCADLLKQLSPSIDAREFNPKFPAIFPRFVQHAIWRYCAQSGLGLCNGNRIDDRQRCDLVYCRLFRSCDRRVLG